MLHHQVQRDCFFFFCLRLLPNAANCLYVKMVHLQILLPLFLGLATEEYKCAFQQDKHGGSGPI